MENQIIKELPSDCHSSDRDSASDSAPDQPLEVQSDHEPASAPDQPLQVQSDHEPASAPDQPLQVQSDHEPASVVWQSDHEPAEPKIDTTPNVQENAEPEDDQPRQTPPKDTEAPEGSEGRRMTQAWPRSSIDINALKNEIITVGMQAATDGDAETVFELVLKFGQVTIPNDTLINMYNTLGYCMLHYAVMYKKMECIETLIELGADIERQANTENRDTPLLLAIRYLNSCPFGCGKEERKEIEENKVEIIKYLISQGCKVNATNKNNESPIVLATMMQNLEIIQELMKKPELNVNARGLQKKTPLHIVAATNNYEIAEMLLHHGADVHVKDANGSTPLHVACYHGSFDVAELIFKKRPEIHETLLMEKDRAGNIPLMAAKKSSKADSADIINFFISQNVDVQCTNELGDTLLHTFGTIDNAESSLIITKRDPTLLKRQNIYHQTPLHSAAMMGHKGSLLVFIENGADINVRDNDEMTPLMLAIKAGKVDIITIMLDLGCDIHSEAKHEKSLIVWAIENEYTALLQALIERGDEAVKQTVDDEENTFLHVAAKSGAIKSIKVLMTSSDPAGLVHAENIHCHTALHVAAKHGRLQCLKELLDSKSAITRTDKQGNNALHIACIHGQLHIVQFLLQQNGLCAESSNGYLGTPLSCAAYHGHDHIVNFLLNQNVCCDGSYAELKVSPLLLATQRGHLKVVKVLLDYPRIDVTLTDKVGYNALAEAVVKGYCEIALEIINSDHWDKAMRMCNDNNVTPMRLLIEFMPDLAGVVLDKCITTEEQNNNGTPCVTQIMYNYEFIDDFDDEPQLDILGNILLKTVLRCKSEDQGRDVPLVVINHHSENNNDDQDLEMAASSITPASIMPSGKYWGPNVYDKENHTMTLMVEHKRAELLQHPLVTELLHHKWNKIALPSVLLQLITYLVFLVFFTSYVLLLPNPKGDICVSNSTTDECPDFSTARRDYLSTATVLLVIFSFINLALEGLQAFNRKLKYFSEWRNYVEIGLSSLIISFVFSIRFNDCLCPNASQWQLGCVAMFLAWIDLILLMSAIPFVAISINMLISIMKTFVKLALLPVLLIFSFGIPLYLLFHQPGNDDAFASVGSTLLKSIIMTTGELDFNDNFIDRDVYYPFLYFFWILFVIVMPVLFNNLLVGLAVGDTGEQLQKAALTELRLQVDLVTELEKRLPSVRLYFYNKFHVLKKPYGVMSRLEFFRSTKFDKKVNAVKNSKEKNCNVIEEYQKKNPIETIKDRLHEQENEIRLLKDLVVKGFKGIKDFSSQNVSNGVACSVADDNEINKLSRMSLDELNDGRENYNGPELPLSVPNLF